jgi:hypothetical protein
MPNILASTQQHLDIHDIDRGMVILKNGSARMVLSCTAVNFDLLSETEQDAIIAAYSALLNSLSFPIQVVVRSKKMDISFYLDQLKEVEKDQTNKFLKKRIASYRQYIEQLISKNEVLDKSFYVIIPHQEMLLTSPENPLKKLFSRGKDVRFNKSKVLKKAQIQLEPKKEHLIKQFNKIGIRTKQLGTQELIELFYDIYNPDLARQQHLRGAEEYTAPLVRPAVET